jgi:hypothetical protein
MPYVEDQKKLKAPELPKSTICLCMHCEERFGSNNGTCAMFCKNCKTKEQRAEITRQNKEIENERDTAKA